MAPVEEASRLAAGTVLSGPAGGMSGGRRCADLVGIPDLVPFDMGGTSHRHLADLGRAGVAVRRRHAGRPAHRAAQPRHREHRGRRRLDRQRRCQPHACGSGRKARARCRVRPATAMAGRPRPSPTPMSCSAISMPPPSWAASVRSIAPRRKPPSIVSPTSMELSRVEAAAGIYRMINLNMADGIRLMTLRRGVDPRKFALLSFGGAAGLHAAEVARELEIKRIIVPTVASVLSAWGMLTSDLRYEVSRTHYGAAARITADEVRELFAELEQQAAGRLRSWFNGKIAIERSAEMRYGEQIFEIDVSLDGLDWNARRSGRPDRGSLSRQARGTLHLRLARPGSRVRQRPRRRRRRSGAAGRGRARGRGIQRLFAARHSGRPSSAAGATFRSMRSTSLQPGPHADRPRHHRGRDHDRAGRHRRPRHGQCAGMAGYCAAVIALGWASEAVHRSTIRRLMGARRYVLATAANISAHDRRWVWRHKLLWLGVRGRVDENKNKMAVAAFCRRIVAWRRSRPRPPA